MGLFDLFKRKIFEFLEAQFWWFVLGRILGSVKRNEWEEISLIVKKGKFTELYEGVYIFFLNGKDLRKFYILKGKFQ